MLKTTPSIAIALVAALMAGPATADIAVSANDGKQTLKNGVTVVPSPPMADSVSVFDMSVSPPREIARIPAPASVNGPPGSVAVSRDESFAIVTASRKLAPGDPTAAVLDNTVTVIALKDGPPRVVGTYQAGAGASGAAINPQMTLALVANRGDGTVSVFRIGKGGVLSSAGTIALGAPTSGPSQPAFYDNGRRALVSSDGDGKVSVLAIHEGDKDVIVGVIGSIDMPKAYPVDIVGSRKFAAVGHGNAKQGGIGGLALIDLRGELPKVVDDVETGYTVETAEMSPDGRYVAVNIHNGSGAAPTAATYNPNGLLQIWRIDGVKLKKVAEAPDGAWGQGIAWSRDGKTLLVQASLDRRLDVFAFDGKSLKLTKSMPMPAAPVALGTAY